MKKSNVYISFLLILAIGVSSCGKDFLNEDTSIGVPVDKAILSEGDMMESLAGTYRILDGYFVYGRNAIVFGDLLADNVYISRTNSARLLPQNNYSYVAANGEARLLWAQTYNAILQANRIIAAEIKESTVSNHLRGEALALRAFCYLNLVNWYAKSYNVTPNGDGVPLILVPANIGGALIKPARNTVAEVYTQIIADLDKAYELMQEVAPTIHVNSTNFISKYGAKALQSRAYLYKGDYANARDAALLVVEKGGYTLSATTAAFTAYWASNAARTDKLETIFELNNSATANNGVEGLDHMYSRTGLGDLLVTDDTYAIYSATDWRRGLIVQAARGGDQVYYVNKYQNNAATDRDEIKLIRYAEVLLTLAESYARLNDNTNGQKYLNMVAQKRDPSLTAYDLTGTALVDAIILERRKELAFEGLRFFDLSRLNVAFNRQNMGTKAYSFYVEVKTTDFRRIQPIPELEITANPNIKPNPDY